MDKLQSFGQTLLPVAVAAAIFSGAFLRPSPAPETSTVHSKAPEVARPAEDTPATGWISDLRPVMETMGDAMGLSLQRDAVGRTGDVTASELDRVQPADVNRAITTARTSLESHLSPTGTTCVPDASDTSLTSAQRTLSAYLLTDKDSDSSPRKVRSAVADAALNELEDWRALIELARHASTAAAQDRPTYAVRFIVATIPDYVDSNTGWVADQSLAAIQSAMSWSGYLLDRFRLVDWTRADQHGDNPVVNSSRLHERQPGALIFRSLQVDANELVVVLLALETPTSGVHRTAVRNAIRFVHTWNRCTGVSLPAQLNVLGPTFSGSSRSLAMSLGDQEDAFLAGIAPIRVISGSATADDNPEIFGRFAPKATFAAAVPPTSEMQRVMSAYLGQMNSAWESGNHVAILQESNTAYGQSGTGAFRTGPFKDASVFTFPLHVSQLRNDAPASKASTVTLLPTPVVPLDMRESTPPADQIPALRPQLESSVVESTVDTIIDAIRHKRLSAVGIQATDDRDALFLAREVKRGAPDVQLFLLSAHALYLNQDYVPYLRGTLVASPYTLSLMTQSGFGGINSKRYEPFQSMLAEGVFNATLLLLDRSDQMLDYCARPKSPPCAPPVRISVIGEDGFWPLAGVERTQTVTNPDGLPYTQQADDRWTPVPLELPPLPTQTIVISTLLALFVLAHVLMVLDVAIGLRQRKSVRSFLEWPVLRVLAPPATYRAASQLHRLSLLMCFIILALVSAWIAAALSPFIPGSTAVVTVVATLLAAALTLIPALSLISGNEVLPDEWPQAEVKKTRWLLMPALPLLLATMVTFGFYLAELLMQPGPPADDLVLTLGRLVGGGIVSPGPATLCLFAALYTALFAAMRRFSLVGYGYAHLETSQAFALLNSSASGVNHGAARLGDVLDMPAQTMPLTYGIGILLALVIASFIVWGISTVDGWAFAWFLRCASLTVLMFGLMNLAQGLTIWHTARAHLKWLALSSIDGTFKSIASLVPWDVSVGPPRVMELMPIARRADGIIAKLLAMAGRSQRSYGPPDPFTALETRLIEMNLAIRRGDFKAEEKRANLKPYVKMLEEELREQPQAAISQSSTWKELWNLANVIVTLLASTAWQRVTADRAVSPAASPSEPAVVTYGGPPEGAAVGGVSTRVKIATVVETTAGQADSLTKDESAAVFQQCEEFVALLFAFVLRDVVARTVAALFTALLCLTFLTGAHLMYSFNPRSSLLTVDLLAITGASLTSIWILVSMEREPVLSRLRDTTPGRVNFSWTFAQRLAVYGVFPLIAVLASLFPEIGNSLFSWLEPLRKLTNF